MNLPIDIKQSKQFCFWKYIPNSNPTKKPIKKPYGFCEKTNKLIPSLKNPEYWLNWQKILDILPQTGNRWGIGLILNGGPYVVIDLDDCIKKNKNEKMYFIEGTEAILKLFPNAYTEISPSNCGIHIIFRGEWPYEQNKGVRPLDAKSNSGTIEIYSGKDCRFITLTGHVLKPHDTYNKQLPSNFDSEMRFLYFKYLEKSLPNKLQDKYKLIQSPPERLSCNYKQSLNTLTFQKEFECIKQKIQKSPYFDQYLSFCQKNNAKYKSISENDWHFCLFVLKFFTAEQANCPEILELFLVSERPGRNKLERRDYTYKTAHNAIIKAKEEQLIGCLKSKKKTVALKTVKKIDILKLCNTMNIFHLGQNKNSTNISEIINEDPNNYLKATIPHSLNSRDYDYYIQIIEQAARKTRQENLTIANLNDKYLTIEINIKEILDNLGLTIGGSAYNNFIDSLRKISQVTIQQNKNINNGNRLSEYSGNLLSYFYNQESDYKKLTVYLNLLTVKIMIEGKYNYSIFNLNSYRSLPDHRLRFLYYFFCLKTIPGGPTIEYTIDQLLESLWQTSTSRETIKSRRKTLISLIETLKKRNTKIHDLNINLKKSKNKIIGVSVKKMQMKIE